MAYTALKDVTIGYDVEDPEKPGRSLTRFFKEGEEVPAEGIEDHLEALVANGYLEEDEGGDDE